MKLLCFTICEDIQRIIRENVLAIAVNDHDVPGLMEKQLFDYPVIFIKHFTMLLIRKY
jgi:hypothetical protein